MIMIIMTITITITLTITITITITIIIIITITITIHLGDDSGLSRMQGMKSNPLGHRDYNEHTRKLVRSNSVPTHHVSNLLPTQGLETPGGYSSSQNDVATGTGIGPGLGEFRTPQSTRSGAKISGLGSKDWAKSEPAHVSPLLILENALRLATGKC